MTDKIPFDVELWKSGKYDVVTRNGKLVLSIYLHPIDCTYPLSAITEERHNADFYTISGNYEAKRESEYDLFLITKKRKVWIGINKNDPYERKSFGTTFACLDKSDLGVLDPNDWHTIEVELPE